MVKKFGDTTIVEEQLTNIIKPLVGHQAFGANDDGSSGSGPMFDFCAYACVLFVNERGYHSTTLIDRLVGLNPTPTKRRMAMEAREKRAKKAMVYKSSAKRKMRRKELRRLGRRRKAAHAVRENLFEPGAKPVSYTHLTLPTIYSV